MPSGTGYIVHSTHILHTNAMALATYVLSLCISLPTLVTVVAVNCCWWLCATAISWKYLCATGDGDAKCHHHRQAIDNRPKFYRNYFSQLDEDLMSIANSLGDKCQAINSHKPICPSIYAMRSKSIRRKWIYERERETDSSSRQTVSRAQSNVSLNEL